MQVYNNAGTASVVWDYQVEIDNTNQFDQAVLGTNQVDIGASKVSALGSGNQIKAGTETSFVVGNQNFVGENTTNVTIFGEGHSVDDQAQNAQILGGSSNIISGSNQSTIVGSTGTTIVNCDNSVSINGTSDTLLDSDITTAINSHQNEVIVNGSGHAVIGLNREGAGLDLLNTRNNSNFLGDTYIGGGYLVDSFTKNVGDGTVINLTGSSYGDGKHETLYILNWNGLSPGTASINLPSAANSNYKGVVYTFKLASGGAGEVVRLIPFTGAQTIDGATSYQTSGSYAFVSIHASGSKWHVIDSSTGTGGGGPSTPAFPFTGSAQITGSLGVTGSIRGNVTTMTITNSTASMDLSKSNAFYLFLNTGSVFVTASNIQANQHVSLFVSQSNLNTLYFSKDFFFSTPYTPTQVSGARDILTFETYNTNPPSLLNTVTNKNIVSASGGPVSQFVSASGGQVTTSGSYKIHTFTASGDFTVTQEGPISQFLMVAGGGGGGKANAGGGGAGGYFASGSDISTAYFAPVSTYAVVVGAGGAGGTTNTGSLGNNSSAFGITTYGGGGGGSIAGSGAQFNGVNGGSGGGGANNGATVGAGGLATSGSVAGALGNIGGQPTTNINGPGGGGGGSGAAGSANSGNTGGNGGVGTANSITGTSLFYAGGGGGGSNATGGTGGSSVGGDGGSGTSVGGNAVANRGSGGGGGAGGSANGGNGSTGVVIIKYKFQ